MATRLKAAPAGQCTGCSAFVYADIYHKCGQPYRVGGPEGVEVELEPLIAAGDGGWFSEPPDVKQTAARTHCERCKEPLRADEFHRCADLDGVRAAQPAPGAAAISPTEQQHAPSPLSPGAASESAAPGSLKTIEQDPLTCSVRTDLYGADAERVKYERMWAREQYRMVSPGENIAQLFMQVAKPRNGAHIIDFGCGTGRGGLAVAIAANLGQIDVEVDLVDFAANCLDPHVVDTIKGQAPEAKTRLRFTQADLAGVLPTSLTAEYGFCTDVMEHIPPAEVDKVLINILQSAQHVFFQISLTDDVCGALIGEPLHLSVHDAAWWLAKFAALGAQVHYSEHDAQNLIVYVTAWSTGQDVVEIGVLNVAEETIREHVRTNVRAGWQQVRPYMPNDKEVLLLGGGPSLEGQLETIRFLRDRGAILVTMNGAFGWALSKELKVSGTVVVDAREFNARFTHPLEQAGNSPDLAALIEHTHYLIGSQVHPSVLEGLPKDRTFLWHTTAEMVQDILEQEYPKDEDGRAVWYSIVGGCTVLTRAIPLLRMLGYSKFHLFGCDSCLEDWSAKHHAYAQPENDGQMSLPVIVGGRRFDCAPWMIAQATEFIEIVKRLGDLFQIEVHGGGLLSWILEHGAALEDARELKEFQKRAVHGMQ